MQSSLASRLRFERFRRGLTLEEAAAQMGIDSHTLSRAERGMQKPQAPTLKKIAAGYAVPLEELLEEELVLPKAEAAPLEEVKLPPERRAMFEYARATLERDGNMIAHELNALPNRPTPREWERGKEQLEELLTFMGNHLEDLRSSGVGLHLRETLLGGDTDSETYDAAERLRDVWNHATGKTPQLVREWVQRRAEVAELDDPDLLRRLSEIEARSFRHVGG